MSIEKGYIESIVSYHLNTTLNNNRGECKEAITILWTNNFKHTLCSTLYIWSTDNNCNVNYSHYVLDIHRDEHPIFVEPVPNIQVKGKSLMDLIYQFLKNNEKLFTRCDLVKEIDENMKEKKYELLVEKNKRNCDLMKKSLDELNINQLKKIEEKITSDGWTLSYSIEYGINHGKFIIYQDSEKIESDVEFLNCKNIHLIASIYNDMINVAADDAPLEYLTDCTGDLLCEELRFSSLINKIEKKIDNTRDLILAKEAFHNESIRFTLSEHFKEIMQNLSDTLLIKNEELYETFIRIFNLSDISFKHDITVVQYHIQKGRISNEYGRYLINK